MFLGEKQSPDYVAEGHILASAEHADIVEAVLDVNTALVEQPVAEVAIDFKTTVVKLALGNLAQTLGILGSVELLEKTVGEIGSLGFNEPDQAKRDHPSPCIVIRCVD